MDRTYIQLMIFKLSLIEKNIKKGINMLQTADYETTEEKPEVSDVTSQQVLYQLDKLEKECANFFADAFSYKDLEDARTEELRKEIQREIDNGV